MRSSVLTEATTSTCCPSPWRQNCRIPTSWTQSLSCFLQLFFTEGAMTATVHTNIFYVYSSCQPIWQRVLRRCQHSGKWSKYLRVQQASPEQWTFQRWEVTHRTAGLAKCQIIIDAVLLTVSFSDKRHHIWSKTAMFVKFTLQYHLTHYWLLSRGQLDLCHCVVAFFRVQILLFLLLQFFFSGLFIVFSYVIGSSTPTMANSRKQQGACSLCWVLVMAA